MIEAGNDHGQLMDDVYRYQRLIYDITRKYYLLGRDHLIAEMAPKEDAHILEVACGTGRNLALIRRRYPGRTLYGLDISEQMLATARAKLDDEIALAMGDACAFDPKALFDRENFDHIVLSYSLSMIPDWRGAISHATSQLARGGTLHIVDFGDQSDLPVWFKKVLRNWLIRFHVAPRDGLEGILHEMVQTERLRVQHQPLFRTYAQYAHVTVA
ncbi:class I SAM-dependent methyltransferase [Aestuariibius sp. 2305UL40-4]|uniref:class I SAM-dependent methyltransferase n=1 Tax=Aestuariibius violaceus TaxID=3234132 RepID=UPI00345EA182